jgi:ketopantoate reductase
VRQGLGLGTFVVGLVAGSRFAASLGSRVWSGHYADSRAPSARPYRANPAGWDFREPQGVIAQTGTMQRLLFGEFDGRRSKRVEDFYRICVAGGINAEISPDIRREIWQKFVFLVALSGATTSMRMALGPIRENPRTRQFFLDLMKEVVAVGRARGIALPADYAEQRMNFADGLPRDMIASCTMTYNKASHWNWPGSVVPWSISARRWACRPR